MTTYALMIGATTFGETDLPARPETEENTRSVNRLFETLGIAEDNRVVLVGSRATRIGCESRLKKLCKTLQEGDIVWFYYAGYAIPYEDRSHLVCADTDPDDIETTAWNLWEILEKVRATGAKTVALFDVSIPDDFVGEIGFIFDDLDELFDRESGDVCLCANLHVGLSYVNAERGLSVWTELLLQGITGAAEYPLTTRNLFDYLKDEMPKSLRKVAEGKAVQTRGYSAHRIQS